MMKRRCFLALALAAGAGRLLQRQARRRAGGRQERQRRRPAAGPAGGTQSRRGAGRRRRRSAQPRRARPTSRASSTSTTTATSIKPEFQSLIEAHARFLKANSSRQRVASKATPTSAAAANTTWRWASGAPRPCAARWPAGRARQPDRSRELRQGKAGRAGQRRGGVGAEPPRRDRLPLMSTPPPRTPLARGLAAACLRAVPGASSIASAALFEDDEARRAILELRQRVEAQRAAAERQAEDLRAEETRSCAAACWTCRTRSRRCAARSRA